LKPKILKMEGIPYIGEVLSLLTAVVWAAAVILFKKSGESVHPIALNLFKNTLALVLMLPTGLLFSQALFRAAPASEYLLLMASGTIGIALGDTLFFKSLNRIGAGLTAIVVCLYSPFIIGLSVVWLGERLDSLQILGALMVVAAVLFTTRRGTVSRLTRTDLLGGVFWGILATACMAVGIVMIKSLLNRSPLLWATEVRLVGAVPALAIIALVHPLRRRVLMSLKTPGSVRYTLAGSFIGAYMAMLLWLAGMKYAPVSVASALNQTSNIFVVLLAALFLREPLTTKRIAAVGLAFAGALLVSLG
jgi:drug/metabolite transporter (DMT)-like permease